MGRIEKKRRKVKGKSKCLGERGRDSKRGKHNGVKMELNGKWRDLDNGKEVNRQSENRERESGRERELEQSTERKTEGIGEVGYMVQEGTL